jgi:pyruvate,water dikinase
VVGRARVVRSLKEIGRIQEGDILVTNSTDPGWTPVFMVLRGIVLETGGLVAHGALLAREYGFPGVQCENATGLIPDGALIALDGTAGTITLLPEELEAA